MIQMIWILVLNFFPYFYIKLILVQILDLLNIGSKENIKMSHCKFCVRDK